MTCYTIWGDPQDNPPSEEPSIDECIRDFCPQLFPGGPRSWKCMQDYGYEPPVHDYTGVTTKAIPQGGVFN